MSLGQHPHIFSSSTVGLCFPDDDDPTSILYAPYIDTVQSRYSTLHSQVQGSRAWREAARAEKDAGFDKGPTIQVSLFECAICGVHIGAEYVEKEVYLLPIFNPIVLQKGEKPTKKHNLVIRLKDGYVSYKPQERDWLFCCGGCGRHQKLNPVLKLLDERQCTTNMLIRKAGEPIKHLENPADIEQVYKAITPYIDARILFLMTTFSMFVARNDIRYLARAYEMKQEELRKKQQEQHDLQTLASALSTQPEIQSIPVPASTSTVSDRVRAIARTGAQSIGSIRSRIFSSSSHALPSPQGVGLRVAATIAS